MGAHITECMCTTDKFTPKRYIPYTYAIRPCPRIYEMRTQFGRAARDMCIECVSLARRNNKNVQVTYVEQARIYRNIRTNTSVYYVCVFI